MVDQRRYRLLVGTTGWRRLAGRLCGYENVQKPSTAAAPGFLVARRYRGVQNGYRQDAGGKILSSSGFSTTHETLSLPVERVQWPIATQKTRPRVRQPNDLNRLL